MHAATTKEVSEDVKQACLDMKTGLYGATSAALKPMLAVFKGESKEAVDNYAELISSATDYMDKATQAAK